MERHRQRPDRHPRRRRDLRHRRLGGGRGGGYRGGIWNFNGTTWTRSLPSRRPGDGRLGLLDQRRLCRRRGGPGRAVERHELERRLGHRARPGSPEWRPSATGPSWRSAATASRRRRPASPATPIATTTALTSTPGSAPFGGPVTFTATITPASTGSAAPTGSVAFFRRLDPARGRDRLERRGDAHHHRLARRHQLDHRDV